MLVDTHAHLFKQKFYDQQIEQIVKDLSKNNIEKVILASAEIEDNNLEPEEDSFALGEVEYKEPENEMIEPVFDEIVEQSHTEQENSEKDSLDNLFGENNEIADDEYNISSDTNRASSNKRNKILLRRPQNGKSSLRKNQAAC